MREPDDPEASGLHRGVTGAVPLERRSMGMKLEAVGLHHQLVLRPKGIDLTAEDDHVGLRQWKVVQLTQAYDPILERGPSSGLANVLEKTTEWFQAVSAMTARIGRPERAHVQAATSVGLLEHRRQGSLVHHLRDIEEGPCNGGHWDAVDQRALVSVDSAFVKDYAGALSASRCGDFGSSPIGQAPKRRRAAMAQQRFGSVRHDGSEPLAAAIQVITTPRVDRAVNRMQPSGFNSAPYRALADTGRKELLP